MLWCERARLVAASHSLIHKLMLWTTVVVVCDLGCGRYGAIARLVGVLFQQLKPTHTSSSNIGYSEYIVLHVVG